MASWSGREGEVMHNGGDALGTAIEMEMVESCPKWNSARDVLAFGRLEHPH